MALVLPEVLANLVELMMDPFGNYLVQKMLDRCNEEQRLEVRHGSRRTKLHPLACQALHHMIFVMVCMLTVFANHADSACHMLPAVAEDRRCVGRLGGGGPQHARDPRRTEAYRDADHQGAGAGRGHVLTSCPSLPGT